MIKIYVSEAHMHMNFMPLWTPTQTMICTKPSLHSNPWSGFPSTDKPQFGHFASSCTLQIVSQTSDTKGRATSQTIVCWFRCEQQATVFLQLWFSNIVSDPSLWPFTKYGMSGDICSDVTNHSQGFSKRSLMVDTCLLCTVCLKTEKRFPLYHHIFLKGDGGTQSIFTVSFFP